MSTGLYTHVTRAAGTIVSAALYNTAHQNHLQNDIPNQCGAHSDTLVQMQTTQDPAPLGVPNLVAALADELEQLRFELTDIKTAMQGGTPPAQWYVPVVAPTTIQQAKGARVYRNTTQAISLKTSTACIFNTVRWDTGVDGSFTDLFWSAGSPTKLNAVVGGLYQINGFLEWDASSGGVLAAFIRLNGSKLIAASEWTTPTTVFPKLSVSTQYLLTAGDYVELLAFQNINASVNVINPEFAVELMNPSAVIAPLTQFTLMIAESGSGTGVVTSDVGSINCPGVCSDIYADGTVVTLTPTPDAGSVFDHWAGDVPGGDETDNPLVITMDQTRSITAFFELVGMLYGFGPTPVIGSTGTLFMSPAINTFTTHASEVDAACTIPSTITLKSLAITLTATLGGLRQMQFRYVVNGVVSNAISLVMIIGSGQSAVATGTLTVNANDTLSIQIDSTVAAPSVAVQGFTGRYFPS